MPEGYCTVDDFRRALNDAGLPGDASQDRDIVIDAIVSQTEWLQETTNRHWYDSGGVDEDEDDLIPTEPLTHEFDEQDIPAGPHADNVQSFRHGGRTRPVYPRRLSGPYTRVTLARRDVDDLSQLLIRGQSGEYTDWTETHDEGRGEDYYLQVDDSTGRMYLYIDTRPLPRLDGYKAAVVATYEYGIEGADAARTVRRAIALRAVAQYLTDDEAALGIPDSGQLMNAESKVQALERQAAELLDIHL